LLESGLQLYVTTYLQQTYEALGLEIYGELRSLALFAAENLAAHGLENPLAVLLHEEEDLESLEQWLALGHLILTASGEVRKSLNKTIGFPADKTPRAQEMKSRAHNLLERVQHNTAVVEKIKALRRLPATRYAPAQWETLEALIQLLPLAVLELQNIFRSQGQVDFIEISGAAHAALGSPSAPEELLLQLDGQIRHILVDEFQDTSFSQYDLLRCLTAGWEIGDGRTLFVVGDPMQSIYRFREAEVGLYLRVCQHGLDNLPMERIVLSTNFRSRKELVDWTNSRFRDLFPLEEDEVRGAVRFAPAVAFDQAMSISTVSTHGFVGRQDLAEAKKVVDLIREARQELAGGTIAVLVRSRSHLLAIVKELKSAGLVFQAQEIDPLIDRPVVQDLLALTRALWHVADRVAWLSVLRAPWCGLGLDDLTNLCGVDAKTTIWQLLNHPVGQTEMFDHISEEGRLRLSRIMPALDRALKNRGRLSLRCLIESTWLAMNGPACIDETDLLDVKQFFVLLDEFDNEESIETLEKQLVSLYAAPDPKSGPELQLMTIHKAKGLEFDTVILPGLGRRVRTPERALLRWLEHPDYELLLAPIPPLLSNKPEPTYQAIGQIMQEKDDLETLRLLYVAVTRAKSRLHLLGHLNINRDNQLVAPAGSLLSFLWPVCKEDFSANTTAASTVGETEKVFMKLRRLPLQWHPPRLADPLVIDENAVRLASGSGHYQEQALSSRRTEEGMVIGTLVHAWLERFARDGLSRWSGRSISDLTGVFKSHLNSCGVPSSRLDACASLVICCLTNTSRSERGQWLLACHREAATELAINGIVDGQLVRATIDRTFVCERGFRWVVDYKTSQPGSGETQEGFMAKELERYGTQLRIYVELMKQFKPDDLVLRAALYFPLFDGWIEA
jgi:ATP-dependent exoDNAse (exonuclease V) beta subunit